MQKETHLIDIARPYQKEFISSPKRYKLACWSRQVGKSWSLAFLLVMKALQYGKNGLSICISINLRSASEILNKCKQFAEAIKVLSKGAITYSASFDKVVFSTGSRVISLPGTMDGAAVRGWTVNGALVIDEAGFIRGLDDLIQALGPTLTTSPNAEFIVASTPSGKNHKFYDMYCTALNDDNWYVSTITIHDAVAQGLNVDIQQLHNLCPDTDKFAQEYECKFASEYSSLIDISLIDFTDNIPQGRHFLGMDVGSKHDRSAIVNIIEKDSHIYIDDIQILQKATYTEQQAKVENIYAKTQPYGYVDSNGIGSALAEYINKKCPKIKGFVTTAANKTSLYEYLRAKIFEHKFHVRKKFQPIIISDFNNISRIISEDGKVHYSAEHNAEGHSDVASALVLGMQAEREHQQNAAMPVSYSNYTAFGNYRSRI